MSAVKFPHLLSPGSIGPMQLRNRIVLAPMGSYMAGLDGHISERHIRFYEERARGGAGLITTEVVAVEFLSRYSNLRTDSTRRRKCRSRAGGGSSISCGHMARRC